MYVAANFVHKMLAIGLVYLCCKSNMHVTMYDQALEDYNVLNTYVLLYLCIFIFVM